MEDRTAAAADETGLVLAVSHLPPGTSKWNKTEHHQFSYITQNWCGRPLTSYDVIVNLIAATLQICLRLFRIGSLVDRLRTVLYFL